jgi:hypothetical protein
MERRKALQARKGLSRGNGLKARTGLRATKSLQPRSAKMKKIYKDRAPFVKKFLALHPKCEARWDENCYTISTDVHEVLPRGVGGKIVDDNWDNFMAVCRYCHTMITDNPKEAHKRGLRKWSWE